MLFEAAVPEDAAPVGNVVELGADHARASGQQTIGIDGDQHAEERRREINPHGVPNPTRRCRGNRSCRVHARPGERRLYHYIAGEQSTGEQPGIAHQVDAIARVKDGQHQTARDRKLGKKGDQRAGRARDRYDEFDWRPAKGVAEHGRNRQNAGQPSDELGDYGATLHRALSELKTDLPVAEFLTTHFTDRKYSELRDAVKRMVEVMTRPTQIAPAPSHFATNGSATDFDSRGGSRGDMGR